MLSVSAVCQDFQKYLQIIEDLEGVGEVKKEICNYLLRPLLLTNVRLGRLKIL
jgi:hypothetical protein